jgi:hypothetical protein
MEATVALSTQRVLQLYPTNLEITQEGPCAFLACPPDPNRSVLLYKAAIGGLRSWFDDTPLYAVISPAEHYPPLLVLASLGSAIDDPVNPLVQFVRACVEEIAQLEAVRESALDWMLISRWQFRGNYWEVPASHTLLLSRSITLRGDLHSVYEGVGFDYSSDADTVARALLTRVRMVPTEDSRSAREWQKWVTAARHESGALVSSARV